MLWSFQTALAQTANPVLRGKVADGENTKPVADASVVVSNTGKFTTTDADGAFAIPDLSPGKYSLIISRAGFFPYQDLVEVKAGGQPDLNINLVRDPENTAQPAQELPTITLSEISSDSETGEVANLLVSSRDVFQSVSGFSWFSFRFRERGYDGGLNKVYVNGVPFNDPETGFASYADFRGLNDVFRQRTNTVGLNPSEVSFGGLGGTTSFDTRASNQRKQLRISYNYNNISKNRVAATFSTGLMPGGWAVSLSAAHRWAQTGYVDGAIQQSTSYFLSVDKRINPEHALNLTFFGAPSIRGRVSESYVDMFKYAGTHYYNPLWGYQNGEIRNSQIGRNNQPTGILRYDYTPSTRSKVTIATYAQVGYNSLTRINWVNGSNPAPDYNYKLPISQPDSAVWANVLSQNKDLRQIDWASLYEANRNNVATINNVNGVAGNTVTGKRSVYIVEDHRSATTEAGANLLFSTVFTPRLNLNGGLEYQYFQAHNYKVIDDLLGGDYWADWDFFGQFDPSTNVDGRQSDLLHPNRLVKKGDTFGYSYNENIRTSHAWAQAQFSLPHFQFFGSGEVGRTNQWRTGLYQDGRYPTTSLGDSHQFDWITYGLKGGAVWKANGRNYLYVNGYYGTKPPSFRSTFVSADYRNASTPGVDVSTVRSIEGGYILRTPVIKARITGYFTEFLNETETSYAPSVTASRVLANYDFGGLDIGNDDTFLQLPLFLGGANMTGVNKRHTGVEIGVEGKVTPSLTLSGAASIGKYIYTSRPTFYLAPDNTSTIINLGKVYQENFYVPRTPQTTGTVAVRYDSRHFWNVTLSANYVADQYFDFDRLRRTPLYVAGLTPSDAIWRTVIDQQKAPASVTVDLHASKSWRIERKYFISFNLGINNLLNNQNIIISGREAYINDFKTTINDPRFFTSRVLYAPGLNFMAGIALRM